MTRDRARFTAADQRAFARLSGDRNPVHLDASAARRVVAGEPIVHGVHLLLRMIESHFGEASSHGTSRGRSSSRSDTGRVSIAIAFRQPALVGERIRFTRDSEGRLAAQAEGGATLALATIAPTPATAVGATSGGRGFQPRLGGPERATLHGFDRARAAKPPRGSRVRTAADLEGAAGAMATPAAPPIARAFPRAARALGADVVAAIAGLSALVGMEIPGRDSLLSAIRIDVAPRDRPKRIDWRVERVDGRFHLVTIAVDGAGIAGTIDAFLRPAPPAPATIAGAAARVGPFELAGARALIVGGSRGLGAATATLIAAGGGAAIVTYALGKSETASMQREARSAGRAIAALRIDVRAPGASKAVRDAIARFGVTQLYYFASPRIFVRRRGPFDETLFERFAEFYVSAFARISAAALDAAPSLTVFYPSTVAIDDVPADLTEYATAKAAGECVCRALAEEHRRARIIVRRLPRISTDQTTSILAAPALDPFDAMLPIVREMHHARAGVA